MIPLLKSAIGNRQSAIFLLLLAFCLLTSSFCPLLASPLDPSSWTITSSQPSSPLIPETADNNLDTAWTSPAAQSPGTAITIDLGKPCFIHRLYLTPGKNIAAYPRALRLLVGDTPDSLRLLLQRNLPFDIQTNLRFNPVTTRILRLELTGPGAGYPWSIAEIMVYGATNPPPAPAAWVLVDQQAPKPIRIAADELRYYLTELTGQPVVRVFSPPPSSSTDFVFHLPTPPPLPPYESFITDPRAQLLEQSTITRTNNTITINGPTPLAILRGAYAFLDHHGVRFLTPTPLGDSVPSPSSNLQFPALPMPNDTMTNDVPFAKRYANWNTERDESERDEYLWLLRNGWNTSWNGWINDRPGVPTPAKTPPFGYTHTFNDLVPGTLFAEHPDWFPLFRHPRWIPRIGLMNLNKRIPYETTWGLNFCTSSTGVLDHIAQRILDTSAPATIDDIVWLVPMDACSWCECDACRAQDAPDQQDSDQWKGGLAMSNRYMTFICAVADRLRALRPNLKIGAFAYEGYLQPPSKFPHLPANVVVDVVQYGQYHLPLSSPANHLMRDVMNGWRQRWDAGSDVGASLATPAHGDHVGVYDWALLIGNAKQMPFPMVTALADRISTYHRLGVRRIGTQADAEPDVVQANPWNFYAYSRLILHPDESPETTLHDFFTGYYGNAAPAMLAWYRALESHILANTITVDVTFNYKPTRTLFPDNLVTQLAIHLTEARATADTWVTRQRVATAAAGLAWTLNHLSP